MIRDLATVLWVGGGFLLLAGAPFLIPPGHGRSVRDPALAAANDLAAIAVGERRAAVEARVHFILRRPDGIELFHHPACPVVRIELQFTPAGPKLGGDEDRVAAVSSPYLANFPRPQHLVPDRP